MIQLQLIHLLIKSFFFLNECKGHPQKALLVKAAFIRATLKIDKILYGLLKVNDTHEVHFVW